MLAERDLGRDGRQANWLTASGQNPIGKKKGKKASAEV